MKKTLLLMFAALVSGNAMAEALTDVDDIVARANLAAYYAGSDGRSEVRMIITDGQGRQQRRQFTVLRRDVASRMSRIVGGREWVRLGAVELGLDCLRRYLLGLPVRERIDFEKT